ncbi:uncharacterized protein LOC135694043 isoform X2 [Rhopilema esculentum]|uniref:uncharacterized protein LOC135694043 isoform X2 n=1 Tax=Rhopilema esculentum TaxID=499914 RepID=UPI0031D09901
MTSEDVAKAVAKRLKFYLDQQRREDAFDLSGPQHPERDHPAVRPGSSLAYDGLHDRSLKHYYRQKNVKQQLQKMKTVGGAGGREKQVKKTIERTMQNYNYKLTPNTISPYAMPLIHPKDTSREDTEVRQRKGSKKKKHPRMVVGKSPKVSRRAPDELVSLHEKERLVNMATKLIVATETIALPQNVKRTRGNQTDTRERLPLVSAGGIERRTSSASDPGPRATPQPPRYKGSGRHPVARKWNDSSSGELSLDSTMDSVRSQMQHLKLETRGNGYLVSQNNQSPPASPDENSFSSKSKPRPKSAGDQLSPNQTDSDLDDFYNQTPPNVSPMTSSRPAWKDTDAAHSVDNATQTVESKGTQTLDDPQSPVQHAPLRQVSTGASSRFTSFDHSLESSGAQMEEAVQTTPPEIRSQVLPYEIFVVTGDKLGAGTSSDVKINLFGQYGDSGERPLIRSKSNKNPFERKQVDLFIIDSIFLGELRSIRIGHNGTALGTGWFLDRVVVREGEDAKRAFEFKCGRWLSARDDDGQIVRDLPLSSTLQGNEVPNISTSKRTYFNYRPDSASSKEGEKKQFRPLSASKSSNAVPIKAVPSDDKKKEDRTKPNRQFFSADSTDSSPSEDEISTKSSDKTKKQTKEIDSKEQKGYAEVGDKKGRQIEKGNPDEIELKESLTHEQMNGETNETKPKRRTKKKKERKRSQEKLERSREEQGDQSDLVNYDASDKKDFPAENDTRDQENENTEPDFEAVSASKGEPQTEGENMKGEAKEKRGMAEEEEITPTEQDSMQAENVAKEEADDSDDRSSSSSSGSELFSVSSDSTSSSDSEEEDKDEERKVSKNDSDEEEEVERIPKDTTKKEDSDSETRKTSAQDDYMAGFMAAVKAQQEDKHKEEPKESLFTKGPNIHQAAENGDFERMKELIAEVPDVKSKPDERGWTPLHIVSAFGYLDILKWLSVNGVNLSEETPTGFSAIHLAAMNGHVKCLMVLAAMGCSLSCRTVDESTPLHLAAMSGHVECVKWLLANRANPDVHDANGRTPLDLATEYQHEGCAELLDLMATEMKRKDSIISKLRHPIMQDHNEQMSGSSKGTDSGVGGVESGEDAWVSDAEDEVIGRGERVQSAKSRSDSAKFRRKSKQEERAMEEKEEKRKLYDKQREKMQRRESSFLDSIRQDIDLDDNDDDF